MRNELTEITPPWDQGQVETINLFAELGFKYGPQFLQLDGPNRADAVANLLMDAGKLIKDAIVSGRYSGVARRDETRFTVLATKRHVNGLYPASDIERALAKIYPFLEEVSEGIPQAKEQLELWQQAQRAA